MTYNIGTIIADYCYRSKLPNLKVIILSWRATEVNLLGAQFEN